MRWPRCSSGSSSSARRCCWSTSGATPNPLFTASLWRNRNFLLGNAGTFLVCVGMFSAMMFTSLMLRNVFGYAPVPASNALLLMAAAAVVFGIWGGALTGRLGPVIPWAAGFALTAASFVALAALVSPTGSAVWLFALAAVSGAGQGLPLAPTTTVALSEVAPEAAAEATGWFDFSHNLGRAVAIGGLGAVFVPGDPTSYTTIFWVSAPLTALGALLVLGLRRAPRPATDSGGLTVSTAHAGPSAPGTSMPGKRSESA